MVNSDYTYRHRLVVDRMIFLASLATILFVASSVWMMRDAYCAVKGFDRPAVLSIVAFAIIGEAMAILWLLAWSGK